MAEVELTIDSLRLSLFNRDWVVTLKERLGKRYLPIRIRSLQAYTINRLLAGVNPREMLDYELSRAGIDTTNCKLQSVIISRFENSVFYAKLLLTYHDKPYEVDCPLGKAMALAVRAEVPIFASDTLLNKVAIDVSV